MPVWGWMLLIAGLSLLAVAAVLAIVRTTHGMRANEPLHGDPANIVGTVPMHVSAADSMTARELEAEHGRAAEPEHLGGTPTPGRRSI